MPDLSKQILVYAGIEQSPVNDFTTDTAWNRTELTSMASDGEAGASPLVVRVPDGDVPDRTGSGVKFLSAHNVVKVTVGSNTLFRGRINATDVSRGPTRGTRPQERDLTLSDYNDDLRGIIVQNWSRPEESDAARVQALVTAYLSGDPRPSTDLDGSTHVILSSNLVTVEAKEYSAVTPMEILQELAQTADKEMFVDVDGNLHYHGHDYAGFDSTLRISDDLADLDSVTMVPIEPTSTIEQREQTTVVFSYYGEEGTRFVEVGGDAPKCDYWADVYYDDKSVGAAAAARTARSVLQVRRQEPISYTVTVGKPGTIPNLAGNPMTGDDIYKIKAGQRIQFKARAARGGKTQSGDWTGDTFLTTRIRSVTWSFPGSGMPDAYYARLDLERPIRITPQGHGRRPQPKPAPESNPDPGDSLEKFFNANDAGGDAPVWTGLLQNQGGSPGDGAAGSTWYHYKSNSPRQYQDTWAYAAGSSLRVEGYLGCRSSTGGGLMIAFTNVAAGSTVTGANTLESHVLATNPTKHTHADEWTFFTAGPYEAPVGTTSVALGIVGGLTADFDEVSIYTVGDPTANDADAVDYGDFPHESPFFLPSDYVEARLDDLQSQVAALPDSIRNSLSWKIPVRVASTANGTLATAFENGDTLDGVTLATGDRILLKDQTTGADRGIYVVNASGAPTRADDFDDDSEAPGAVILVMEGTANADTIYVCTTDEPITLGTTSLTFTALSSGGSGSVATDTIWDAKGDLAAGTGADTASKLTVGADDTILMADSAAGTGLKWVASASPSAVGTAAATGTADTFTRGDHVHAHEAAHTAHDTAWAAKGDLIAGTANDTAGILSVGSNNKVLTADSTQTTGLSWVEFSSVPSADVVQVASGAGSIRIPGLGSHPGKNGRWGGGITEEYDTGTTGLTWSPTTPGTINSNSTVESHLYLEWTGSGSTETLGLRAWSPAGAAAFSARMHVNLQKANDANSDSCGLLITSSGDTSRLLVQINQNARGGGLVQAFTYAAGSYTQRGNDWTGLFPGADFYLRIDRDGSNNVSFYQSATGKVWTLITSLSFTLTVANIGFRLAENGTSTLFVASDFLRTDV